MAADLAKVDVPAGLADGDVPVWDAEAGTWVASGAAGVMGYSQGTLASRPAAGAVQPKHLYLATDVAGGTLFESNGTTTWTQLAAGVTEVTTETARALAAEAGLVSTASLTTQGFAIASSSTDASFSNTSAEETLTTLALPANRLAIGDSAQFKCFGDMTQNFGSTVTLTLRFKLGAETVATDAINITSSGQPRKWRCVVDVQVISASLARVSMLLSISIGNAASWVSSTSEITATGYSEVSFGHTAAVNCILTAQMGTATALSTITKRSSSLLHFPATFTALTGPQGIPGTQGIQGDVGPQGAPGEDAIFGTLPQTTLATAGGGYHYTIPGFSPIAAATLLALAANTIYYEPFEVWDSSYWPNIAVEVTTASPIIRTVTDAVLDNSTTLISSSAAFTSVDVGRVVVGTGIQDNTKIESVTNATTAIMNKVATQSATDVTVQFRAKLALAVYEANNYWQPVNLVASLLPVNSIDAGFVNEHIREIGLIIPGGRYLSAIWTDGTPTMRTVATGSPYGFFITGSSGINVNRSTVVRSFTGVWEDPGVAPDTIVRSGTPGAYHTAFLLPGDA